MGWFTLRVILGVQMCQLDLTNKHANLHLCGLMAALNVFYRAPDRIPTQGSTYPGTGPRLACSQC